MNKEVLLILTALERIRSYCSERTCDKCPLWSNIKNNKSDFECALRGNRNRPEDWEITFDAKITL